MKILWIDDKSCSLPLRPRALNKYATDNVFFFSQSSESKLYQICTRILTARSLKSTMSSVAAVASPAAVAQGVGGAAVKSTSSPAKKKTAAKKTGGAAARKQVVVDHPKYSEMVRAALTSLKERGGSSRQAVLKYIVKNFKVGTDESVVNTHLKMALRAGVKNASLKQSKGSGATGSFRLGQQQGEGAKKKPAAARAKKSPAKVASKPAKVKPSSPGKKLAKKASAGPKKTKATAAAKPKAAKKAKADKPKKVVSPASPKKKVAAVAKKSTNKAKASVPKKPAAARPKKTATAAKKA